MGSELREYHSPPHYDPSIIYLSIMMMMQLCILRAIKK